MNQKYIQLDSTDNIVAALVDLPKGELVSVAGVDIQLQEDIPAKHKFTIESLDEGATIKMYGVMVGKASHSISQGSRISTENTQHAAQEYGTKDTDVEWQAPDVSKWANKTFNGYHRADGKVGTMNYWIVIPLVFCENRNIKVIQEAMSEQLGYTVDRHFSVDTQALIDQYKNGANAEALLQTEIIRSREELQKNRTFPNVDGIKFLTHDGGCGGIRQDSETLCRLLATYINHPNVAGATVLSLGCQNAQFKLLEKSLNDLNPKFQKPLYILEQQESASEREFIAEAVKKTFVGLIEADKVTRQAAPLKHLSLGLECGGSDGFSGISANPALGYTSDLLVAIGGSTILSEFPELNGVEQELIDRCTSDKLANKFASIMKAYSDSAEAVGSGFKNNPSPGNIKDGLITDAMKSAGAAKKGGTSPVTDVLDYTEVVTKPGLNLLCTPGNDVESTTGLASAGANLIVFTTGLGTPTGNAVTPVIKMSTNNKLNQKMGDIIDINAGTIISGEDTIETKGAELLELLIKVASGEVITHANRLGQDDFIPWKRGVSL